MNEGDWIALIALVFSASALVLELRRWVESGPRIKVRARANMKIVTLGSPSVDEKRYVIVIAANVGSSATTITNLTIHKFDGFAGRWRNRATYNGAVVRPGIPGSEIKLPALLEPGKNWMGVINQIQKDGNLADGSYWVGVTYLHRERPHFAKIFRSDAAPENPKD